MSYDAVLIAGPTASGKSSVALCVAEALGAAIVNADSMQVYRELRVLTARPSDHDMAAAPHHLYGHVSVHEAYSVGRYMNDATRTKEELKLRGAPMIFVGGTGLYFGALTHGLADIPPVPETVRAAIRGTCGSLDGAAIHAALAARDPDTARTLRSSDRQRMVRALEVLEATGTPLSRWQKEQARPVLEGMRVAKFVIDVPRETLRARIAARFERMIAEGALDEVALLESLDSALPAAKILGLRELIALRAGTLGRDEAIERVVTLTRQYAKRQVTWARNRMADWTWISADQPHTIIAEILTELS